MNEIFYLWFQKMEKVVKITIFKANIDDIVHIIDQIKGAVLNRACDSLNKELIKIRYPTPPLPTWCSDGVNVKWGIFSRKPLPRDIFKYNPLSNKYILYKKNMKINKIWEISKFKLPILFYSTDVYLMITMSNFHVWCKIQLTWFNLKLFFHRAGQTTNLLHISIPRTLR